MIAWVVKFPGVQMINEGVSIDNQWNVCKTILVFKVKADLALVQYNASIAIQSQPALSWLIIFCHFSIHFIINITFSY